MAGGVQFKDDQETVEVDCKVVHRTANATLIDDGQEKHGKPVHTWIPNSQVVRWIRDKQDKITGVEIPEWLATEKGLT